MSELSTTEHALLGAPHQYLTPLDRPTLAEAQAWCRRPYNDPLRELPRSDVLSCLRKVRPHFESIYAYCRVADDLGDEVDDPAVATRLLDAWGSMLDECYDAPERSMHPVFVALHETIRACDLPRQLFHDLADAFRWTRSRPSTRPGRSCSSTLTTRRIQSAGSFCGSAATVMRASRLLSDKVCTALQLANFWQDVVEDEERGRRYLPAESMMRFGVEEGQIEGRVFTPEFRAMVKDLVVRTRAMLAEGGEISRHVDRELAVTLNLFRKGGDAILDGIVAQDYDVLRGRPVVSKAKKLSLLGGSLLEKLRAGMTR